MKKTDYSKNVQVIVSYSLIVVSLIMLVFSLGFMTNFYELFVNGTMEMYEYFKDVQILNNAIFNATIISVVLSLGLIAFDITKKRVGIFGSIYSVVVAVVTFFNAQNVLRVNNYFADIYKGMSFSELEGYTKSMFPFAFANVIFIAVIAVSILVALMTVLNIQISTKEESESNGN